MVKHRLLRETEYLLLGVGALALGVCAFIYFQARFYRSREGREFGGGKPPIDSETLESRVIAIPFCASFARFARTT